MFLSTNIETTAYCNRQCEFCFNANRFRRRNMGVMPERLWKKIIDELAEMGFDGRISPYLYGEPLLDDRLPRFTEYATEKLRGAIIIATNGDYLTREVLDKFNGRTQFLVTEYDNRVKPEILALAKDYSHVFYRPMLKKDLVNRAGQIFQQKISHKVPCLRPGQQLVINWEGEVLPCCNDFYAKYSFGNVKDKPIQEIWDSKEFKKFRKMLAKGKRAKVEICKYCDDGGGERRWQA